MSREKDLKKNRLVDSRRTRLFVGFGLVLTLLLGACQAATPAAAPVSTPAPTPIPTDTPAPVATEAKTPGVEVSDQAIENDTVTIAKVVISGPGWLVIHADKDGAPGPVLGYTAVSDGENADVKVTLAAEGRTERLHAMLHTDAGSVGTYEFPGADVPVKADNAVVPFQVTGGVAEAMPTEASPAPAEIQVKITNFAYDPARLTVKAGTTVVWTNEDGAPHTVTADDGSFKSGTLRTGGTFSQTFSTPGEYPYYCEFHGGPGGAGMAGTVVVTG